VVPVGGAGGARRIDERRADVDNVQLRGGVVRQRDGGLAASIASSEPSVATTIFAGNSLISSLITEMAEMGRKCETRIKDSAQRVDAAFITHLRWVKAVRAERRRGVSNGASAARGAVESRIPSRMDRLPWARWHWLVVFALGITWILDGLEVTIVGNIAGRLAEPDSGLNLTEGQIGLAAGIYIAGACTGALFFSYLTDKYGRKRLFLITLGVYLVFSFLTGFSWNFWSFAFFRFMAGTGIGGEYSAIYSAVDELIPARYRGQVALAISGSYWIGTILGSGAAIILLNENIIDQYYGWRIAFWLGALLGICVLLIRRYVPESPRWLLTHGRTEEAEVTTRAIEEEVRRETGRDLPPAEGPPIVVEQRESIGFGVIFKAMFRMYPKRTILGLTLMGSQAFLYNAIFFTYALVLTKFYNIDPSHVPYYIFPFAIGNVLGPWLLGRFFDTIGRVPMISGCYFISGALLAVTGYLFYLGVLTAVTQTILWCVIFFFASAAASAGYLTVSEVFPMEIRAMAIAVFYAVATALGGISGPVIFGNVIGTGNVTNLFIAYLFSAGLMIFAALVEVFLGVRAEGQSLENVARPLTAIEESTGTSAAARA
jgi:MFS family permease